MLLDFDTLRAAACDLIRDIRHRREAINPFVVVMAITWRLDNRDAPAVMSSGADDILIRPLSFELMRARIANLVHCRKPFVATAAYIGPDRRSDDRHKSDEVGLLRVPNTLERKAKQNNTVVVRRMAAALRDVVADLQDGLATGGFGAAERDRLASLSRRLVEQAKQLETQSFGDLAGLLHLANAAVTEVAGGGRPKVEQLEVLRLCGDSLLVALKSGNDDIEQLVKGLRSAVGVLKNRQPISQLHLAA